MISELLINAFLVTIMVSIAIALIKTRTVIFTVILTSAYSLVAALMFITLDAVDVAFTEAAVGSGISTKHRSRAHTRVKRWRVLPLRWGSAPEIRSRVSPSAGMRLRLRPD